MKTAISVPDDTFEQAEQAAADMGLGRSQFYTLAVQKLLRDRADREITAQVNWAIEHSGDPQQRSARELAEQGMGDFADLLEDEDW